MTRFTVPVAPGAAAGTDVEFTVRRDVVEMRVAGHCVAAIERDMLRAWLAFPACSRLLVDEVTWIGLGADQVMLVISRIGAWQLGPRTRDFLRELV